MNKVQEVGGIAIKIPTRQTKKSEGKIGVVVSFLASLELAKDGCVDLIQNNNEEIYIKSKVLNAVNE